MEIPQYLRPFLSEFTEAIKKLFGDNALGIYLHGSLTYGGYIKERSDIDLLILVNEDISSDVSKDLDSLFSGLAETHPEQVKNIELDILLSEEVWKKSKVLRSIYTFKGNKPNGSEMLDGFWIELANVRENGIVLFGSEPKDIIPVIDRVVLFEANKQKFMDLQKNAEKWEKIDLWNQVYILVQASRVLYSLNNDLKLIAKQDALSWAIENAPKQFWQVQGCTLNLAFGFEYRGA